jgi:protein-L-isoaspartate(D-aspartate) O-methyltransferase
MIRLACAVWLALLAPGVGCARGEGPPSARSQSTVTAPSDDSFSDARTRMVERQIAARGVTDPAVLAAMRKVPRHEFVPPAHRDEAYDDHPLPIGHGQTISQPYIVAYMVELARIQPSERVLEVGTGCGYQAAVLGEVARDVFTIEIVKPLADCASSTLDRLAYRNVRVRYGDGYGGWPEHAPFDAIVVAAAPDHVPPALVEQLAVGGRLVIPVGTWNQEIRVITRTEAGTTQERLIPVRFVPLVRDPRPEG